MPDSRYVSACSVCEENEAEGWVLGQLAETAVLEGYSGRGPAVSRQSSDQHSGPVCCYASVKIWAWQASPYGGGSWASRHGHGE